MSDDPRRLIEVAFPLKQTSIDSMHEKSVRHGHISTLHIWPARRPLAACRAALIATLLPDPGNDDERKEILDRLAGRVVQVVKKKKLPSGRVEESVVEETQGGILHWGRENGPDLDWFRKKIREAYGGRAPRVLDPFAGGGAIPLEAMRLGCEVAASDINPVAWLILKCTLEYPQRLSGQTRPLPQFALDSEEFMASFLKAQDRGIGKARVRRKENASQARFVEAPEADLAWHLRAWSWRVLQSARADLERFYPVVNDKPTVAYLWARTVTCKHCRATIPLLKTRWLCKKPNKRVLLTMEPNEAKTGVVFGVQKDVPQGAGGSAQRREHDRLLGAGTMSRSGATCPQSGCGTIMTMDDIKLEGQAHRLDAVITALVVEGQRAKEYRLPTLAETSLSAEAKERLPQAWASIPFGMPEEPTPSPSGTKRDSTTLRLYGSTRWVDMFSARQQLSLATFVAGTRKTTEAMRVSGYPAAWVEALSSLLALIVDKLTDYISSSCTWHIGREQMTHVFVRYALPINWDYAELNPLSDSSGNYSGCLDWVARVTEHVAAAASAGSIEPFIRQASATTADEIITHVDLVLTDPPYYDAIPYSNLMDFFYVWLRRTLLGLSPEFDAAFSEPLSPKWDHELNDGELVDDPSRFGGNFPRAKAAYEDGMFRAFQACDRALSADGRMVIVFANKQPQAWETLVSALIRAGFVVDGSWPIQTEMGSGIRTLNRASLSSSVWLVCKKRPETARPGWDNRVLEEMHERIATRLRDFWDAGIRGPDFVWAATGPALEAYSKHPAVKKANDPGELMTVSEFLEHARRMVVEFIVGRVLSEAGAESEASGLDDVTTYYLLHRHDFGLGDAPVGACILYAISCGLSDTALTGRYEILARSGGQASADDEAVEDTAEDEDAEAETGGGNKVRLLLWSQRRRKGLGYDAPVGRSVPLIDQAHRLMQLWRAGDVNEVDDYLDARGLRHNDLFHQILQALIELSSAGTEERALLESISNHVSAGSAVAALSRLL